MATKQVRHQEEREDGTFIGKTLKKEFASEDRLWASWGDYDRRQFERVCKDQNVGYPFGPSHLNVKSLFAAAVGSGHETHHRGDDDAWYIADILCRLLRTMRGGVDE
jgi:inhibitor of KinA sporulation pathway (predicted exonuclease)